MDDAAIDSVGWGGVDAAEVEIPRPNVVLPGQPNQGARARGRPKGSFGSRLLRSMRRCSRTDDDGDDRDDGDDVCHDVPGQDDRESAGRSVQAAQPVVAVTSFCQDLGPHVYGSGLGQVLWTVCSKAAEGRGSREATKSDMAFKPMLDWARNVTSLKAESARLQVDRGTLAKDIKHCATSVLAMSKHAWGGFLKAIQDRISTSWKPLGLFKRRRYDETPTKIKTARPGVNGKDASTAKVFQTEFTAAVLFRHVSENKAVLVQTTCPPIITCCEDSSEPCVRGCQRYAESCLPDLHELVHPGPGVHSFSLPCSDRHASNLACEAAISAQDGDWLLAHTLCDVHKASQIQTVMLAFLKSQISGLISCALSMYSAGATHKLRQALFEVLDDTVDVREGEPRETWTDYSSSVLSLFWMPLLMTVDEFHRSAFSVSGTYS